VSAATQVGSTAQPEPSVAPTATARARGAWLRVLPQASWLVAFAVLGQAFLGRFGFNPTDQGFILAQSQRLRHGQVPHVDVVSARPLGSPVLHVLDLLLPGPLFEVSGALTLLEIGVTGLALTALLTGRPVRTWGPGLTGVAIAVSLLDLHSVPVMAWHTIDGLFMTSVGWWLLDGALRSGRSWPRWVGLLLLGYAAIVKQSFAPAPLIGLAMIALHPAAAAREGRWSRAWWRRRVPDVVLLCAAPAAYVVWVVAAGGLHAMVAQLTGGMLADDRRLLIGPWVSAAMPSGLPARRDLLVLIAFTVVLWAVRRRRDRLGRAGAPLDRLLVLAGFAGLARVLVAQKLDYLGDWVVELWWMALAMAVLHGVLRRRFPSRMALVVVLGAMSSLSWGVATPTYLAGALTLVVVLVLVTGMPMATWHRSTAVRVLGGALVVVVAAGAAVLSHNRAPYRDQPRDRLTADLGAVMPALSGIRSNPATATYLRQLDRCLTRYPAGQVAVLTDNPFVYSARNLHNPFPLDWPLAAELVADARTRMLDTASMLNRRGDYLVLFQTVTPRSLTRGRVPPATISQTRPIVADGDLAHEIDSRLTGVRFTCGSFKGVYAPPR
jgi:hypothetical protein